MAVAASAARTRSVARPPLVQNSMVRMSIDGIVGKAVPVWDGTAAVMG